MPDISSSLSKREVNARQNTYTKSEIDLKDGAIQAIAEAAQTTADAAEKKNQEQDQLIAELQKSAHTHSNKSVLDKIEQPYTTAERDKLAGLENYVHPSHTAYVKGFYKFASDGKGHVTDAEKVTKKDITDLGVPGDDTNTTYKLELPTYTNPKEPPAPMLSLNGSDGSENRQAIPCAYTVLDDVVYKKFSGFKIGGNYRSVADLAFVIPRSARIYPWRITAHISLETPSGSTYIHLHYILEITDEGSSIRRYLGNGKYYSGNSCTTNDWAILSDLQNFSNPSRDVWLYRIGVPDNVFSKLTNSTCKARLVYQTGKNGDVVKPVSYYTDITFDETVHAMDTDLVYVLTKADVSDVAFTGSYNDLSDKPTIPDISGKQDKLTAGTNITINGNVISAKDTTYNDVTQSAHGLMSAADKKKLDGIAAGATKVAVDSALSATSTNPVQNKAVKAALDSKSASGHTHAMIANSALWVSGANNTAKWVKLGTLVSSGNFSNAMIRVWSGDGANGRANQNSSFEVQIKDGWQSTESATKACGVTVYRVDCSSVKVKVIPTAHDTYTVWAYLPWGYWNGNYAVYGKYKSWTSQQLIQSEEPEGTGANTAYYDQAFLTSTVANATTWNGLINDVDTYNSSDTGILVKKDNRIQHRYAGELDVNSAKTLVDSGWKKPTFASGVKSSSIRYRKQGKIVSVTGYVQFSAEQTTITVFTLPTGYRPPAKIQQFNAVDSSAQASFLTKIDTDGKVGFFGKTRGFFTTATEYYMHCTFFVD